MDSFLSNSLSIFFYNQITCVSNYLSQSEAVVKSVISKTSPSCKIDKAMKENKRDKNDKTKQSDFGCVLWFVYAV